MEDDRSYGDRRGAPVPAPEVAAFREMSHAQGYFISIMHSAHKRENRQYARETIRLPEFTREISPGGGTRVAELICCRIADFIARRLIIGSLTVHRWFIDVNEHRRENIAAL